ncbi:MAG TPA: DUF6249 domain-containing protein [Anaeromyxobacter sp.]|nr:DUF6249 domain-containing protein [Anaeromyxobacter sp.]
MLDPAVMGQITGMVISTFFFLAGAAVLIGALYFRHRSREARHQTIRLALEKGQPLPPELLELPRRHRNDLSIGVKLVAVGTGISVFLFLVERRAWPSGLVLVSLGIGYLVSHALTRDRARGEAAGAGPR